MRELLEILNKWQAQYMVIGAHALGMYTEPRATKDLDVWVNPTPENAKRVLAAIQEYGVPLFDTTGQFFEERNSFLVIGVEPNRIDILKDVPGVEFESCWERRRVFDVHEVRAIFLGPDDLLAAKLAAGRPQDLIDAGKLKKAIELDKGRPHTRETKGPKPVQTKPRRPRRGKGSGQDH